MVSAVFASPAGGVDAVFYARHHYLFDVCAQDGLEHLAAGQYQVTTFAWSDVSGHDCA